MHKHPSRLLKLGFTLILVGAGALSGQEKPSVNPRSIQVECKILEIRKTETTVMSNPRCLGKDGETMSAMMGTRIPVELPSGKTEYLDDKIEFQVLPCIVPDVGIKLTVRASIQKVDPHTRGIRQTILNNVAMVGNLETMVMELMVNKKDGSRIVLQMTPMIVPTPQPADS